MMTFRDGRVCGDLDGEYFKNSKWNENERECIICDNERRKGRKLLGGPIPPNTDPLNYNGQICCALKPDECCMQNPYASSGLPYAAAHGLIITFNVMFWIYIVLMTTYCPSCVSFSCFKSTKYIWFVKRFSSLPSR